MAAKKTGSKKEKPSPAIATSTVVSDDVKSGEQSASLSADSFANIEDMYAGRELKEARNSEEILKKVRVCIQATTPFFLFTTLHDIFFCFIKGWTCFFGETQVFCPCFFMKY